MTGRKRSDSGKYLKRDQRLRRDPTVNGIAEAIREQMEGAYDCLLRCFTT
jgi:hypothetical protein